MMVVAEENSTNSRGALLVMIEQCRRGDLGAQDRNDPVRGEVADQRTSSTIAAWNKREPVRLP